MIDVQYVGLGEQRKFTLSFNGNKVSLRGTARDGRDILVDGEAGD